MPRIGETEGPTALERAWALSVAYLLGFLLKNFALTQGTQLGLGSLLSRCGARAF